MSTTTSTGTGPQLLDLRPDRAHLNPHFDGYKLTLQPLPKLRTPLVAAPGRRHASDEQYSYLHAQLFSTHNHLHSDPYTAGAYYFVDAAGGVRSVRYAADSGQLRLSGAGRGDETAARALYTPATTIERYAGDYNATLVFVSGKCVVLADGSGGLSVLETGDRVEEGVAVSEWRLLYAVRPLDVATAAGVDDTGDDETASQSRFVMLDARLDHVDGTKRVHCVLLHIAKVADAFETVLDWVVCEEQQPTSMSASPWHCSSLKRLRSKCMPQYCALEAKGTALLLAGDHPFILEGVDDRTPPPAADTSSDTSFCWHQTTEDVIIRLDVLKAMQTADVRVVTERRRVCVTDTSTTTAGGCPAKVLLDAQLYGDIDAALTTWLLENETLTLTLVKAADDLPDWPSLLRDEAGDGSSVGPPATEFLDNGAREAFSIAGSEMQEMEDCDFGGNDAGREFFLERLDAATNQRTHRCPLGTNAPLFSVALRAGHPAALALRNDIDVCIWQPPVSIASTAADWRPVHEGTLDALGYVQASKTQKKYIQCSPDLRYAVISEPQRHVFIYQARCEATAGLKNRRAGAAAAAKPSVGQQRLFAMAPDEEIVGLAVDAEVTLLLTEREVIAVQINA